MKTITCIVALSVIALLTGCNTIRGAGEDIQKAGNAIENAAKR